MVKFIERNIIDFKNGIKRIFDMVSIEGKYKVIGSSNLKNILYNSDYDLAESDEFKSLKNGQEFIYNKFKNIFDKVEKDNKVFITDFKCGIDSNKEPLRWKKEDIDKGYIKMADGKEKTFADCLIDPNNTIKIDIISLIDGVFVDFSENLYFKFGSGKDAITNYNIKDITKNKILESIKQDYFDKIKENKYLKALKRKFAYYKLLDTEKHNNILNELLDFFNSSIGIIGKAYSDIETIILLIETNETKAKIEDIVNNLQVIKQNLTYIAEAPSFSEIINKICLCKSKKAIKNKLIKLNEKIFNYITKETKKFYKEKHYSLKRI